VLGSQQYLERDQRNQQPFLHLLVHIDDAALDEIGLRDRVHLS
jgi:hypothetical protein